MKRHSEIIKEFGLYLLLFVSVSAVAISEEINGEFTETIAIFGNDSVETGNNYESTNGETSEISVTIVETPSSEDVDDTNTGDANTGDTNTGDTNTGDTNTGEITDSKDSKADDNPDPGIMPPNSNPDESTYEERSIDKWWEWVLSTITSEDIMLPPLPPVEDTIDFTTTGDLP
ncbi:MAG TPA: pentapeptide repeat-containing protein [Methanotrichaceae archaeon]|nr:pentapeptide repeat-containing protein [Methanotrichaceae archaeon]